MYLYDDPRYKFNIFFLTLFANSPSRNVYHYIAAISFTVLLLCSALFFQISLLISRNYHMRAIVETVPNIGTIISILGYTCIAYGNRHRYDQLILLMEQKSSVNQSSREESEIMRKYEDTARLIVILLMTVGFIGPVLVCLPSLTPQFLDFIIPLNESRVRALPFGGKHYIDEEKYFYELLCFQFITALLLTNLVTTTESFFCLAIHHVCGLLTIIGYKFQRALEINYESAREDKVDYETRVLEDIRLCIKLHCEVLEFIAIVTSCSEIIILLVLVILVGVFSISLIQVTNVELIDLKSTLFTVAQIMQFALINAAGQLLINESQKLPQKMYAARWYDNSVNVQKLFVILLMRAYKISSVCAKNMYVLCLQNFSKVTQTAISYFMVLRQFQ